MWPFGKPLAARVKDAINQWPPLQSMSLDVSDDRGNIRIVGTVPRQPHLDLLKSTVEGVKGVKSVDVGGVILGEVEVSESDIANAEASVQQAEAELRQAVEASALAKKVLKAIEANGELADDPIDVLQKGTGVVLRGAVDNQHESNLAVQIAKGQGATAVDVSGLKVEAGAKEKFAAEQKAYVNIPDEWYTVQAGDTLSEIAQKFYGDGSRDSYAKIARANNISNPDLIKVGQKLQIPR